MRPVLVFLTLGALAGSLKLARKGATITDEDSCPPPSANIGPKSLLGPIHSCSWCVSRISEPEPVAPDADWVRLAFKNEASKPVQIFEAVAPGAAANAAQTFEGWAKHQDHSGGGTEHRVVAGGAPVAFDGEVATGLPVDSGKEITFRARHGTLLRARSLDDGELLLEHRVGRVRLMAEPPADAHAHHFGVDDSDEWRSTKPPKPLEKSISSAPGAKKPPRPVPAKKGELKEDHRFVVKFLNHLPVPLDLYFYAPKEGTETLQNTVAPYGQIAIKTYWRSQFVVRDPVSGLRVAQLAIPVVPIRDCGSEKTAAFAAKYLRGAVAVGVHAPDDVNATGFVVNGTGVGSLAAQLVVDDASR